MHDHAVLRQRFCTLTATRLPAGAAHLAASCRGSAIFAASTSPAAVLTVAKATSKTTLSLPVGTRTLVAAYPGSSDFTSSASARQTLTVVK